MSLYFVDRMRSEPLLLVAAYRPRDASVRLLHQIANWHATARRLPIPHLTLEEATEFVIALHDSRMKGGANGGINRVINGTSSDSTLAAQLYAKSAGNPYFLLELIRAPSGETPPALAKAVVTWRLGRVKR